MNAIAFRRYARLVKSAAEIGGALQPRAIDDLQVAAIAAEKTPEQIAEDITDMCNLFALRVKLAQLITASE